ncbi:helix-turn-helix domain-containing protein [Heliobacillus mobilis]|uniref:Helix-turn-helix domain-containing protein n=1 Tax=Heliobacterium mobile TaxID=28064 RepID=A0A6I3SG40_HELMO|nr:helix-turn-helix transcriptional regulator [Heliobacterium mobile]MTV47724.1 helix-turn-helix domain-containing protein [Heliobacterium mobile]
MLGERLKKLREQKSLSQTELGNHFSLSKQAISGYENGTRSPDATTLGLLADFFSVSVDYLLGRTDIPSPKQAVLDIERALSDDTELALFFNELKDRDDLQLLFKQVRPMSPEDIKKIIRVIKAIEDEEAQEG